MQVVRPVLEPHEVARGHLRARRAGGAAEPELGPAQHDDPAADPAEVAHRVERDLRVVGASLHHDVAAGARRVELVARERRQVDRAQRAARRDPEPVLAVAHEQRRPDAERDGEVAPAPDRSPRRCRRAAGARSARRGSGGPPCVIAQRRPSTRAAARARPRNVALDHVERGEDAAGPGRRWRCPPGARRRTAIVLPLARVVALGGRRGARGDAQRGPGGTGADPPSIARLDRRGGCGPGSRPHAHAPTTGRPPSTSGSASASIAGSSCACRRRSGRCRARSRRRSR